MTKAISESIFIAGSVPQKMAGAEGFEPPVGLTPYTAVQVRRYQPLCHAPHPPGAIVRVSTFTKTFGEVA